jgi:hypothetical protein
MSTSSSASRFCEPGTSKKPPQVSHTVGGGIELDSRGFKHGGGSYRTGGGLANGKLRSDVGNDTYNISYRPLRDLA